MAKTPQTTRGNGAESQAKGAESNLAGLVHGSGDDERSVPVELRVADFSAVSPQDVKAPEKTRDVQQ